MPATRSNSRSCSPTISGPRRARASPHRPERGGGGMGMARLLAKGWVAFCLFAGAHALQATLARGVPWPDAASMIGICTLLFTAMGLLFAGGYAAGSDHGNPLQRLLPSHLFPGFNEIVFVFFAVMSFAVQVVYAPLHLSDDTVDALKAAIAFAVPG